MRIPRKFALKGKTWTVKQQVGLELDGFVCTGLCDLEKRTIYVEKTLGPKAKKAAFLHELFHAVIYEAHINPGTKFGSGLEEVLCDAFTDVVQSCLTVKWKRGAR